MKKWMGEVGEVSVSQDKSNRRSEQIMAEVTPMMKQYLEIKEANKDAILFFRLGDFYEMFFDDAILMSKELELTLTGKDCGLDERAPMCGIPFHAADTYLARLIKKGYKVAICEQVEDPKQAKGLVKREIVRMVTPGTVTDILMLDEKNNNYICSIYKLSNSYGLCFSDVSTGEISCTEFLGSDSFFNLLDELARIKPSEVIINELMEKSENEINVIKKKFGIYVSKLTDDFFDRENAVKLLKEKIDDFNEDNEKWSMAYVSVGAMLKYLTEIQKANLEHINHLEVYESSKFMKIDLSTRRNLELTETMRDKKKKGTLLWVMDSTNTAMGARLMHSFVDRPLIDVEKINSRLNAVEVLKDNPILRSDIIEKLDKIYDIERLTGKIVYGSANARDLVALKLSLKALPELKELLANIDDELLNELNHEIDLLSDVTNLIEKAIIDEAPITTKEGGIIKTGYNEEVDKLRYIGTNGKSVIAELEAKEREKTGIKNLKIAYNKVFGYYIEVTRSYFDLVPETYIRKQTLADKERYIIEELKELEETITSAEEKIIALEYEIFSQVRNYIALQVERLQKTAISIANIDVLVGLADIAEKNNYVKPIVDECGIIDIKNGRHPVVEKCISDGEFVPNDTFLDFDDNKINIITGPNMAGKSTYMRQVALITLMAQIGSFVPADYAKIGITDRIFTRVGASDDLAMGQSTFMVEMSEVANILNNATSKSLVILDEIGRGTSTFDGLSIAWAVVEHISSKIHSRTLFATHYHELTELENKIEGVKNYCISVKEKGEDVIFLRKILRGGADGSYGIHVAKLAGVPYAVVNRAKEVMKELEDNDISKKQTKETKKSAPVFGQVDIFNLKGAKIADELERLDLNGVTPIDALNILYKLKDELPRN